jgi:hypothetical protein
MSAEIIITREKLNEYLKQLGKEYRKRSGKGIKAEIVLVGGAAVLAKYNFRYMTTDADAVIRASSAMKDAITAVSNMFNEEKLICPILSVL